MNTFKKLGLGLLLAPMLLLNSACVDELLTEEPTIFVAPETFFNDFQDAEIALIGAYSSLQSGGAFDLTGVPIHWNMKGIDELNTPGWAGGGRRELHLSQITPSLEPIERIWREHYKGINTANGVVDRISAMDADKISPESAQVLIGEARFIRSMYYFSLVKTYENVPLIKNEVLSLENLDIPQATPQEVYDFVIEDLKFAASVLPEGQGGGRATKGAAQSLLGKVYLQMTGAPLNQSDKFALAAAEFKDVIDSKVYRLLDNYGDVFIYTNDNNDEIVFTIGFEGPGLGEGSTVGSYMGPNGSQQNGGGWGTEYISHDLADSYEEGDVRFEQNVARINVNNDDGAIIGKAAWRPWKWQKPKPNNFLYDSPFDFQYLRYADVLLSYAEALSGANNGPTPEALDAINQVRARARGGDGSVVPNFEMMSQSDFMFALQQERRRELCFEGHRKDDLIRMGIYEETVRAIDEPQWSNSGNPGVNFQPFHVRWPIPQRELDLNPSLVQNPGY
ncbi:MAG: RagB/SusD family nutrient uptake outer membrane protein [Bacteroidota bacterium]